MINNLRTIFKKIIIYFIRLLESIKESLNEKTSTKSIPFDDLAPDENVDEDGKYSALLDWALNKDKVTNIAITGTYGSGKSSILQTYQTRNRNKHCFLNISLANFKDIGDNNAEIEKNILLQTFYQVRNNKIPFSRFNRIAEFRYIEALLPLFMLILLSLSGIALFNPKWISNFKENLLILESHALIPSLVVALIFVFSFLYFSFVIPKFCKQHIKVSKIKFDKAEMEVNAKENEGSIFNKHIDEIMYFFAVTEYNVIIFEDLDRFDKVNTISVFTKLREINSLINKSEDIKKKIVFIYALKDDLFTDNTSRTKFFDFIIPIIPVINSSNSCEILNAKFKAANISIDEKFIKEITIYIHDMRTLKNIFNEFMIYKQKLYSVSLNLVNLLGMIVYKNVYPEDFAKLQVDSGIVYNVFQNKNTAIATKISKIRDEIKQIESNIALAEKEKLADIEELKAVYFDAFAAHFKRNNGFFYINANQMQVIHFDKDSMLSRVKNGEVIKSDPYNHNKPSYDYLTANGTKTNYFEREKILLPGKEKRVEELREKICKLEWAIDEVRLTSLKQIFSDKDIISVLFPSKDFEDKKLLVFLLRNGYIDEMYHYYITYFYPGSLSKQDMDFVVSVKNYEALPFDFKLSNFDEIIGRMHNAEFRQKEILNFGLLDYLIVNQTQYETIFQIITEHFSDESEVSINFIEGYLIVGNNKPSFIRMLLNRWKNIWWYIISKTQWSAHKKDFLLSEVIKHGAIGDILALDRDSVLCNYISTKADFLKLVNKDEYLEKITELLTRLKIRFVDLEKPNDDSVIENKLFDYVYTHNMYEINLEMINLVMQTKVDLEVIKKLSKSNYTAITQSGLTNLINYIHDNMETYLVNVFFTLPDNDSESVEAVIELLNNPSISIALKLKIIDKEKVKISNLEELLDKNIWVALLEKDKLELSWKNLLTYYQEVTTFDRPLIEYIAKHYIQLSQTKINLEIADQEDLCNSFSQEIIKSTDIDDKCFEMLKTSIPYIYETFDLDVLSEKRIDSLINSDILTLSQNNFAWLKDNYPDKKTSLIERHIYYYIENLSEYPLEPSEMERLLSSKMITPEQLKSIVNKIEIANLSSDYKLMRKISEITLTPDYGNIRKELFTMMIASNHVTSDDKIKLIIQGLEYLEKETIMGSLTTLGSPYSEIALSGRRPTIADDKLNRELIRSLLEKEYISSWANEGNRLRVNTKLS